MKHRLCLILTIGYTVLIFSASGSSGWSQKNEQRTEAAMPTRGICAHRGAVDTHPENTLPAFREAIRLGAHMIEFDVQLTNDGKLVLMHDTTINRTTNGTGSVGAYSLAELRRLDAGAWKDRKFAGERIPTLTETLRMMPANIWLNVHLKGGAELAAAVTRVIVNEKRLHQAFLACNLSAAVAARKVEPKILICNMDGQRDGLKYVDATIATQGHFLQFFRGEVKRDWVVKLDKRKIRSNYCCTDDADLIRRLFETGVGFVLVDRPESAIQVARQAGIEPLIPVYRQQDAQ